MKLFFSVSFTISNLYTTSRTFWRLIFPYELITSSSNITLSTPICDNRAVFDEPFTFLSPLQIEKVKELILSEKFRKGFIITDHLQQHVLEIQNRLYLLHNCKTHFLQNVNEIEKYGYSNM
jgi:hypothetical protein